MDRLIAGVLRFQRDVIPEKSALFAKLEHMQAPRALFIACSDSRVAPELFTQCEPGDIFVVRNAGNIVPSYGPTAGGVSASVEFAASVLQVRHVVVCGHSDCGAMKAILDGTDLDRLPAVASWLRHADAAKAVIEARHGTDHDHADDHSLARLDALVHENVRAQLINLQTHPAIARRLAVGTLKLHGWSYDVATGAVDALDGRTGSFVSLPDHTDVFAAPLSPMAGS